MESYYENQLARVKVGSTPYPSTVKVFANGNGENTNHLGLSAESAPDLILWLAANFLNDKSLTEVMTKLSEIPEKYKTS